MSQRSLPAILAGVLLASGADAAPRARLVPEGESTRWLVELAGSPRREGGDAQALAAEKRAFRDAARAEGVAYAERFEYAELWNGLAVEIAPGELGRLARLPGVKALHPDAVFERELATSVAMTGADVARSALGFTGAGVRVGVIDGGIDYHHPDLGGCFGPGCRVEKGWDFVDGDADPDDCDGHGTHVAGIIGASGAVTGMAPGVHFGAYRIFACTGGTPASRVLAALERAYLDGMDVVNLSLGSPNQWPQSPTAAAASSLVNAGVVVVASIGNEGWSGLYAASAPGVGKKVIGVAATENAAFHLTHFRVTPDALAIGYFPLEGSPEVPTAGSFPLLRTGSSTTTEDACQPLAPASLAGAVALIRRGGCSFVEKSLHAVDAGAVAVVIYNDEPEFFAGNIGDFPVPVVGTSGQQGLLVDARLETGAVEMTWQPGVASVPNPRAGLAGVFSSLGASPDLAIKPDLAAPGVEIRSTFPIELGSYTSGTGTSMAAPHVSGAAALVLEAHPHMPAQALGAVLQNSADPALWTLDPARGLLDHVHRQGAGSLDVDDAILATLRIEPSELALGEGDAGPVTRTLRLESEAPSAQTFDLSSVPTIATDGVTRPVGFYESTQSVAFNDASGPIDSVTVPAGGSAEIEVTVTPGADGRGGRGLYGGYLFFTPRGGQRYSVPYLGVEGDYQEIVVNALPGAPALTNARLAPDTHFTMQGDDRPIFLVHLRHQVRRLRFEVKASSGKSWHRAFPDFQYVPRNATNSQVFAFSWDGTTSAGKKRYTPPDGEYVVTISMLKANGDDENPAHWETVTLPALTLARAAAGDPTSPPGEPARAGAARLRR